MVLYELSCRTQLQFDGGQNMCTTASLYMGVAILSNKVDVTRDSNEDTVKTMNHVMRVSSQTHSKISRKLSTSGHPSVPVGVNELMEHSNLDFSRFGLQSHMYIVSCMAGNPSFQMTGGKPSSIELSQSNKGGPMYKPIHDLVPPHVIPELLISSPQSLRRCIFSILTCAGHSILLFCGQDELGYGHFDPLNGRLVTGISRGRMQSFVERQMRGVELADLCIISSCE